MPVSWSQVNNMPDTASNNRFMVYFPRIQGVDSQSLSLLVKSVTVPQNSLGHIIVHFQGAAPIAFRGGRQFDNTIEIGFLENVKGQGLRNVELWKKAVRDRDGRGKPKAQYAANGLLELYDTMGKVIFPIDLVNMWPMTIQYPSLTDDGSAPLEFSVTFSVDYAEVMV